MSREIKDLTPDTQAKCKKFIERCKSEGIDVLITCTYRSVEEQNKLYAIGRTIEGKKVTNATGGSSCHQYRCAFDFVPIKNGKAQWANEAIIDKCGSIGESCGLEWAGRWTRFKEKLHLQNTQGLTMADLKKGKTLA